MAKEKKAVESSEVESTEAESTEAEGHDDHHEELVLFGTEVGPKAYWKIWGVLLVLLIISFVGPYAEIKILTLVTAFGIAVVKAYLVCKNFMHLDIQPKFVIYFLTTAVVFMLLLFFGVAPDVLNHEGQNWTNVAAQAAVARGLAAEEEADAPPFVATEVFASTCSLCHGAAGGGDGVAAANLDPHPANFTDPAFWADGSRTHDHIVQTIREGGAAVGRSPTMPAFAQFNEAQASELADLIESFRGEAAPAPQPTEPEGAELAPAPGEDGAGAEAAPEGVAEPEAEPAPEAAAPEAAPEAAAPEAAAPEAAPEPAVEAAE